VSDRLLLLDFDAFFYTACVVISTVARRTRVAGITARCDTPTWWLD